jgi:hypothetical protein
LAVSAAVTSVASIAAVTSITTVTAAILPGRAFLAGAGLVDHEVAAFEWFAMQAIDGGLASFRGSHGDEGKTPRATGFPVKDDGDFLDGAVLLEKGADVGLGGAKGEIPHIQFHDQLVLIAEMNLRPWGAAGRSPRKPHLLGRIPAVCFIQAAGSHAATSRKWQGKSPSGAKILRGDWKRVDE